MGVDTAGNDREAVLKTHAGRPIRVLIVDDSAIVRKILADSLRGEAGIEVVGTAPDPFVARDKIVELKPDVLTLDIEMPRMDGLTFLDKLMRHYPLPAIVISALGASSSLAMEALARGAVEVLAKPAGSHSVGVIGPALAKKVRAAAASRPAARLAAAGTGVQPATAIYPALVAIGASTGGTQAIERVLKEFPAASPPVLIVQHIPSGFSRAFAERLDRVCQIEVREARDGDEVTAGLALVAPGDFHLKLARGGRRVKVESGEPVCFERPSVDVLFRSVAEAGVDRCAAALLTGMGSDGAEGLLALRNAGAWTVAQDERTSAVYGMPREAVRLGAAAKVAPLDRVAGVLLGGARSEPEAEAAHSRPGVRVMPATRSAL